jgi:hypothetical protein
MNTGRTIPLHVRITKVPKAIIVCTSFKTSFLLLAIPVILIRRREMRTRSSLTVAALFVAQVALADGFSLAICDPHSHVCIFNPHHAGTQQQSLGGTTLRTQRNPIRDLSKTRLDMFGNLFGGGDDGADRSKGELASFSNLEKSSADADVAFDSISTYLVEWANLFEGDGGKERGLTTPVTVSKLVSPVPADDADADDDDGVEVMASAGVKFTFTPPKSAFDDRKDKGDDDDSKASGKKKKKETSPGGVQVIAQKISRSSGGSGATEVRLLASRCDIDEGTIIKEMSEQCIADDLRKAVKIWRDERR